jgi:hypothetical protein
MIVPATVVESAVFAVADHISAEFDWLPELAFDIAFEAVGAALPVLIRELREKPRIRVPARTHKENVVYGAFTKPT